MRCCEDKRLRAMVRQASWASTVSPSRPVDLSSDEDYFQDALGNMALTNALSSSRRQLGSERASHQLLSPLMAGAAAESARPERLSRDADTIHAHLHHTADALTAAKAAGSVVRHSRANADANADAHLIEQLQEQLAAAVHSNRLLAVHLADASSEKMAQTPEVGNLSAATAMRRRHAREQVWARDVPPSPTHPNSSVGTRPPPSPIHPNSSLDSLDPGATLPVTPHITPPYPTLPHRAPPCPALPPFYAHPTPSLPHPYPIPTLYSLCPILRPSYAHATPPRGSPR